MEFEQAYQHLNEAQRAAVDYIDGPLLVIAGPGTGKTQLLSVRVANILRQTDTNPENILCLTFTDNAADNMRERLASFIGAEAAYKVQIQTYHAFGSYILQEHRPDLTAAIDELERFTIMRDIQASLDPTDILRSENQTRDIIATISNLKSAALTPNDVRKIVKRNQTDLAEIYAAIEDDIQLTKGLRYPKSSEVYGRILESLKSFVEAPSAQTPIVSDVQPIARSMYRELAEALLAEENSAKPSAKMPGKWREHFFKKDKADRYVFSQDIANKKLLSLANVMERYIEHMNAEGLFDYDDMILQAIDLLQNDDEKRFNAQERFQYILLDEFQDTNEAQAKLVTLLTDNPANEGRPNIMAVGDDDQAIYGFQGADTSNFFNFDEKYHPKQIYLTKNYRSSAEILEFAHNIIEQGQDRFCKATNVNIDKCITAENQPNETNIELREFKAYQAEYSYVTTKIHELLDAGVSGSEIAIIAPKHKYLVSILPYLHTAEIPVSYKRRENILQDDQIIRIFHCAQLLVALHDSPRAAEPYWFEILSYDCWNLTPLQVIQTIQNARSNRRTIIEELLTSEDESLKAVANYLTELSAKIETFSAEFIINELTNKLFSGPRYTDNYLLYSNLNTLHDTIMTKTAHRNDKYLLRDFCHTIEAYDAAEIAILNQSPYHEAADAVHLETVHGAKGLEYQHVFLIAADNDTWSDAKGNTNHFTLPCNLEHVRHTGDSADEKLRVFFVAITRAKAYLYLTYSTSDFSGHNRKRLKFLDIREDKNSAGETQLISHMMPTKYSIVTPTDYREIETANLSPNLWFDAYVPSDNVRRNLLLPYVEHYRMSPTHLNVFLDLTYGDGPYSFLRSYIIGVPGESSFALNYGRYVHEIMDEINKENIDNETALQRFFAKIDSADAEQSEKDDLRKRGEQELGNFLAVRGDEIRSVKADSERGFFTEKTMLGNVPITGKIDRIEIDDEKKTIIVSDFKTSHPHEKWSTSDNTFGYKIQLYFYKFLLENSRDYQNYKVVSGRIDYISPDAAGNIVTLKLNFDDKENAVMRHLIEVVYHHIKTLDLPDTSEALKKSNPTKAFFDQLIAE